MRVLNAVPAIFAIILAVAIMAGTTGLRFWDGFTPGARFFPGWLAAAGAVLAVLLLITQWRGTDVSELDLPDARGLARVAATVAGLAGLVLLARPLGMVPALALFVLFHLLVVLRARLVPSLSTVLVIVILVEGIFVRWLAVPLPAPFFL